MTDLTPTLLSALSSLPACTAASFAREEKPLPIITVAEESASEFARADGAPYLEECVFTADVYAASREEMLSLAQQANAALSALGLRLTGTGEAFDDAAYAWRKTLRYRCLVHRQTIYQ